MPKGRKKGKFEHRRTEQVSSSDEEMGNDFPTDNTSETSGQSDVRSNHDEAGVCDRRMTRSMREKKIYSSVIRPVLYFGWDYWLSMVNEDKANEIKNLQWICGVSKQTTKARYRNIALKMATVMDNVDNDRIGMYEHFLKRDADDLERKMRNLDCAIVRENEAQEKLEEKVLETVEALNARANAARAAALLSLRAALQRRHLSHLLCSHRATLADHVTKALRRGKDGERRAAAAIAPLLALQIGEEGVEEYVRELRPALTATAIDRSATLDARTECCSSLAALCYLLEDDLTEILEVMRVYETIFCGSYLKGDGSVKVSGAAVEEGSWHAAALDGWALLLSLLAPTHAHAQLRTQQPGFTRLADLLSACSLEVRMAAGGALAVAYEQASSSGEEPAQVELVLPLLDELARDSHKYRAKRDRKVQRATFRDILKFFEEGSVPPLSVRVGSESVVCSSWAARAGYGALAASLGAGLQTLAPHCAPLRAALALGEAPPPALHPQPKLNKLQRHLQNTAACKARTVARNKNRDKRSAALAL